MAFAGSKIMRSRDLIIQKFKITIFFRSKSGDHQIPEIITMGSRLLWFLIIKSHKSGSWDHGKIIHEIIGSYILHRIMDFYDMGSWDHRLSWFDIMRSYIFMLWDHGIIHFYDHKNLDYEKWFTRNLVNVLIFDQTLEDNKIKNK